MSYHAPYMEHHIFPSTAVTSNLLHQTSLRLSGTLFLGSNFGQQNDYIKGRGVSLLNFCRRIWLNWKWAHLMARPVSLAFLNHRLVTSHLVAFHLVTSYLVDFHLVDFIWLPIIWWPPIWLPLIWLLFIWFLLIRLLFSWLLFIWLLFIWLLFN